MDNLDKIKFKQSVPGWLIKIDDSGRTEFKVGTRFVNELQSWKDAGNEIEQQLTPDELTQKETDDKQLLYNSFISNRNTLILEADKWELPSIQKRFNITQEQVEEYKQILCGMPTELTVNSTLEELQSPNFPTKLINGLL